MRLGLEGKTVVITGGAGGIGKEAARGFLKEGAAVAVFARTKEKVDDFCREMRGLGYDNFYGEVLDVADKEGVRWFTEKVCRKFGTVDVWINNVFVRCAGRGEDGHRDKDVEGPQVQSGISYSGEPAGVPGRFCCRPCVL